MHMFCICSYIHTYIHICICTYVHIYIYMNISTKFNKDIHQTHLELGTQVHPTSPILNSPKPQHNVVHAVRTTKHVQRLALLAIKHECPTGDMGVSKNSGFSPQIIHFNWGFLLFSPSILGTICFPKLTPKKPGGFRWYRFFWGGTDEIYMQFVD